MRDRVSLRRDSLARRPVTRIEARIADYLAFGVPYVWMIDPAERRAWVYTKEGRREVSDALTTTNPALRIRLDEIFSALDEDLENQRAQRPV